MGNVIDTDLSGLEQLHVRLSVLKLGLAALILTAIAYPIGIISDAFADWLLKGKREKIKKGIYNGEELSKLEVLRRNIDENTTNYFKYLRFKERVSRLTVLNFPLIGLSLLLFFSVTTISFSRSNSMLGTMLLLLFVVLAVGAFFVWKDAVRKSYDLVEQLSK